jgi:hypothetical protein
VVIIIQIGFDWKDKELLTYATSQVFIFLVKFKNAIVLRMGRMILGVYLKKYMLIARKNKGFKVNEM